MDYRWKKVAQKITPVFPYFPSSVYKPNKNKKRSSLLVCLFETGHALRKPRTRGTVLQLCKEGTYNTAGASWRNVIIDTPGEWGSLSARVIDSLP